MDGMDELAGVVMMSRKQYAGRGRVTHDRDQSVWHLIVQCLKGWGIDD